ncbi:MAG TPA: hypothetical protein VLE89_07580 [Chlamydiales bacterium]|nr:hypothetical protein [Chlamydiales bacterium]
MSLQLDHLPLNSVQESMNQIPLEIWKVILEFSPDQHHLARTSTSYNKIMEKVRADFLDVISEEGTIGKILELKPFQRARSNGQRLRGLCKNFLGSPKETPQAFIKAVGEKNIRLDDIFRFSCKFDPNHAISLIDRDLIEPKQIDNAFNAAVEKGDFLSVVRFLPHVKGDLWNALHISLRHAEIFHFLLNCNREISIHRALEDAGPNGKKALLKSGRPYNREFQANAGLNVRGNPTGLHQTLIKSAGTDDLESVRVILKYANPSREMLVHVRARIQFLREHENDDDMVLYHNELPIMMRDVERDNVQNRDAILSLLDDAIAKFPEPVAPAPIAAAPAVPEPIVPPPAVAAAPADPEAEVSDDEEEIADFPPPRPVVCSRGVVIASVAAACLAAGAGLFLSFQNP